MILTPSAKLAYEIWQERNPGVELRIIDLDQMELSDISPPREWRDTDTEAGRQNRHERD